MRIAGTSPAGTSSSAAATQVHHASWMNSHIDGHTIAMNRCSTRVYVTVRPNGRSKRTMPSSCQPPPTAVLPRTGETISTGGGGPAPARAVTLLP
ncbi:hypothetical protein GCM10010297_27020 [Streptomyces malachitofuscus]|nr:hypothetical protein GCM10010297_27020 [Streptomyces malachitofuscus]